MNSGNERPAEYRAGRVTSMWDDQVPACGGQHNKVRDDPCRVVRQVNQILPAPNVAVCSCCIHPWESFSPAGRAGRGRRGL